MYPPDGQVAHAGGPGVGGVDGGVRGAAAGNLWLARVVGILQLCKGAAVIPGYPVADESPLESRNFSRDAGLRFIYNKSPNLVQTFVLMGSIGKSGRLLTSEDSCIPNRAAL